jgi:hypothetical protein
MPGQGSPTYPGGASTAGADQPYGLFQPLLPAKPDAYREEFKERVVKALSERAMASLQQSSEALWQEVATLEGQADKLSKTRQVCLQQCS